MLSTSYHFVPPLQSGIVCLVNFVEVKISVKLPTLFFVLCALVLGLHIPSQYPGVSNAVLQNKPKHKLWFSTFIVRIGGLARMPFFRLRILRFFGANIRILVPEKNTIKNNINNPYILPGTDFDSICIFC